MEDEKVDNYSLIMQRMDQMQKVIDEQAKTIKDVCAFNRTLLTRNSQQDTEPKEDKMAMYGKKLKEALCQKD